MRRFKICSFLLVMLLVGLASGCRSLRVDRSSREGPQGAGSGGGVAGSQSYSLNRSVIGESTGLPASNDQLYRATATLGSYLSQPQSLSDHYLVSHPLSKKALDLPPALQEEQQRASLKFKDSRR